MIKKAASELLKEFLEEVEEIWNKQSCGVSNSGVSVPTNN
jgi:hypothetical protein